MWQLLAQMFKGGMGQQPRFGGVGTAAPSQSPVNTSMPVGAPVQHFAPGESAGMPDSYWGQQSQQQSQSFDPSQFQSGGMGNIWQLLARLYGKQNPLMAKTGPAQFNETSQEPRTFQPGPYQTYRSLFE